ncbi:MAG: metallophosphoesterase family protein [Acidobacteriota bacterium]
MDLVVCGHTHMPFNRKIGTVRVVNAGSVGMPVGNPDAHWLLLGPGIEPRHTAYDFDAAAERIYATTYPQAEDLALKLLRPPTEEQLLEVFSRVELRP